MESQPRMAAAQGRQWGTEAGVCCREESRSGKPALHEIRQPWGCPGLPGRQDRLMALCDLAVTITVGRPGLPPS